MAGVLDKRHRQAFRSADSQSAIVGSIPAGTHINATVCMPFRKDIYHYEGVHRAQQRPKN